MNAIISGMPAGKMHSPACNGRGICYNGTSSIKEEKGCRKYRYFMGLRFL